MFKGHPQDNKGEELKRRAKEGEKNDAIIEILTCYMEYLYRSFWFNLFVTQL
jgi:hypothetical protein